MKGCVSVSLYDDFTKSLLPGNYALTKSMELTKIKSSGTLWYTKKFLTLYYYIFLSGNIMTAAYRDEIVEIFDRYIESLPSAVQPAASRFFFPKTEAINLKSAGFNLFHALPDTQAFLHRRNGRIIIIRQKNTILPFLWAPAGKPALRSF